MTEEHEKPWQPLSPRQIMTTLSAAPFSWWIAGGHAIEHFVGRPLRAHGDMDVLLLRADRGAARAVLEEWDCWAADPPGKLRHWAIDEELPAHVSDVWCRETRQGPWRFQLMLDDGDRRDWRSRRCADVTKPVVELAMRDDGGIPYLAAEVQLFYKAKAPRPKDELDFAAALPLMSDAQKSWLRDAIAMAYGRGNAWLRKIDGQG